MAKRKWTPEEREEFRQQKLRWEQNDREFKAMYERFKERWAAEIANGREAAHQSVGRFNGGENVHVTDIAGDRFLCGRTHQRCVPMHVDQTGHQRAAAARDHGRSGIGRDRCCRNPFDNVAPDENIRWRGEGAALAVEDEDIGEQRLRACGAAANDRE